MPCDDIVGRESLRHSRRSAIYDQETKHRNHKRQGQKCKSSHTHANRRAAIPHRHCDSKQRDADNARKTAKPEKRRTHGQQAQPAPRRIAPESQGGHQAEHGERVAAGIPVVDMHGPHLRGRAESHKHNGSPKLIGSAAKEQPAAESYCHKMAQQIQDTEIEHRNAKKLKPHIAVEKGERGQRRTLIIEHTESLIAFIPLGSIKKQYRQRQNHAGQYEEPSQSVGREWLLI